MWVCDLWFVDGMWECDVQEGDVVCGVWCVVCGLWMVYETDQWVCGKSVGGE